MDFSDTMGDPKQIPMGTMQRLVKVSNQHNTAIPQLKEPVELGFTPWWVLI